MSQSAPEITWRPQPGAPSRMADFIEFLRRDGIVDLPGDYSSLWEWSVTDLSGFWDAVRRFFDVIGDGFDGPALAEERMPGAVWYPGATLNFAENVLRPASDPLRADEDAIIDITEDDVVTRYSWAQLAARVAAVAERLRALGVRRGDRVAAVLPNIPEAIVGLLASAAVGAVWSICSPDLAEDVVVGRFAPLEPVVLIGTTGYAFNGKHFDRTAYLAELVRRLPSVRQVLLIGERPDTTVPVEPFPEPAASVTALDFERVPFDHPLWVLFSSGTTGAPKGIVHGHGGILLEALKTYGMHHDHGPGSVYYVAANTSWMVWNTLAASLATGSSVVTYGGSPTYGTPTRQFDVIARTGTTRFAVGAAYLTLVEKTGARPVDTHDLSTLRGILSTGSPLPPSTWLWVHDAVKPDVHLGSDSGGTDICSGFVGSNPLSPVHLGESQGPVLGVAAAAWDSTGTPVIGEVGELVITRPMPSMPLFLWNDPDGERYRESYFAQFPDVWAQGDWITETERHGVIVHGRSDATLNRQGVRMGSGDVYASVQRVSAVADSLVLGVEGDAGEYWMPLFVAMSPGHELDDDVRAEIVQTIRSHASPRHVPDEIIACPDIPLTHAGKRIEVPLKKLFQRRPLDLDAVRGTLRNPESLDWFVTRAADRSANRTGSDHTAR